MIIILIVFLAYFLIQIYKSQTTRSIFCNHKRSLVPPPHVPATLPQRHHHICPSTIMPRLSTRAIAPRALTAATRCVRQILLIVNFFHLISGDFTVLTEHNESFLALIEFERRLDELRKTRYYLSRPIRKYDKAFLNVIWTTKAIYYG